MENIKTPLEMWPVKNEKMSNFRDRIWFIKYWAEYIKTHTDKEWGKQQKVLIDSQIQSSRHFYKSLKGTKEGRKKLLRILEGLNFLNKKT